MIYSWFFWLILLLVILVGLWIFFGRRRFTNHTICFPEPPKKSTITLKYVPYRRPMEPAEPKTFRSRGEAICCQVLEEIFGKPFVRIRPDFLKNPETNYNLEIDCYNDDLKLGVEWNGVQHYVYPNYTGQSYDEFIKQVRRDKFKVEACDAAGVYLITVPYNTAENMIRDYIIKNLPK